jgi:hypothetical protein
VREGGRGGTLRSIGILFRHGWRRSVGRRLSLLLVNLEEL